MEIVIVAGGMPFGPTTIETKSLGGSETAVINMAKCLRKRGHIVTVFCQLPIGTPDEIRPGSTDADGIRWVNLDQYLPFIVNTEVDLLIVSRNLEFFQGIHQARKAVLWTHDLATYSYTVPGMMGIAWNFDEIWCVSEFHKQQIHKVTGYPLEYIRVTRNGITPIETIDMGKISNQLIFSARPERGLENLVRPGGIMSMLPEFNLKVTMYDNYPQHLQGYYQQLWTWAQQLRNVELLGPKTQAELRQLMRNSFAYVYPTNFEEVSCILAREAMSVGLPFVTTAKGALVETLGACGSFVPDHNVGSREYNELFALTVKRLQAPEVYDAAVARALARVDLGWDSVAADWEAWAEPRKPSIYSLAYSLIEDSDIIAAKALIEQESKQGQPGIDFLYSQICDLYPYLTGKETFHDYYERYYLNEDKKNARWHPHMEGQQRFEAIAAEVAKLPSGAHILDYGCAEGVIILDLAQRFKDRMFTGVDFAESNVALAKKYADERGLNNVNFIAGSTENWPDLMPDFDAVIASEVLEHVTEPWAIASFLESKVKIGGRFILTVPAGSWEATGLYDKNQWYWRAHIWHINKWMLRKMFANKKNCLMANLSHGATDDGRSIGHLIFSYDTDRVPVAPIGPIEKAHQHRSRQTVGAAIIAMNSEESIIKLLNSIHRQVQQINIALGPSDDSTKTLIDSWQKSHPWVFTRVIDIPRITANQMGFDDARNLSLAGLTTDWTLWIDTDEYLSGDFRRFIRHNAFDSYAIHQHHFTCDPRGTPTQLDKPARLFRNNVGFKFYGKVHEHAEKGFNGGPGFCFVLPDVDIGHVGYANEKVRRDRFQRNFPLLEWDRKVYPERKLGHYLWLRDMIHRMRYAQQMGNINEARRLAEEAVAFYRSNWDEFDSFGMGGINALSYYSEAMAFSGRGMALAMVIKIDNNEAPIQGVFETEDEVLRLLRKLLKPEFDKRKSGYM